MPADPEIIIYTMPDCAVCDIVKANLRITEERSLADLASGKIKDPEAMAQLQYQDGGAPVVLVNGYAVSLEALMHMEDLHVGKTSEK